jgi:hypothetical protein
MYLETHLYNSFILGPFFMFRKSVCEKIGFMDEQLKVATDYDFAMRLIRKYKIEMHNGIDGWFLDTNSGLSTKGDNKQPIERTFVELRYKLDYKVDQKFVPFIKNYNMNQLKQFGEWRPLNEVVNLD